MDEMNQTTWRDELEELIQEVIRKVLPKMPGGIAIRGKRALFIDNIAKIAYKTALKYNELHGGDLERQFANIFRYMIDEVANHEFIHTAIRKPSNVSKKEWDAYVERAASKLAREMTRADWMVWSRIPCPKREGEEISFDECLECGDHEKHEECPLWVIRQTFRPRFVEPHVYHMTELTQIRYAYYSRLYDHAEFWDEAAFDFWFGKAGHVYIQQHYPKGQSEIFVWWNIPKSKEYDLADIKIVGSIDAYDPIHRQILFEFKTYATIKFILMRNKPEEEHEFQAQGYVKLAEMSRPWIKPKTVKIIYMAKSRLPRPFYKRGTKVIPKKKAERRYKEFTLKPKPPEDLVDRARELDRALTERKPPNRKCATWKCKMCKYRKRCEEDGWT